MLAKIMLELASVLTGTESVVAMTSHEGYLFVVTSAGKLIRIERT